MNPIILTHPNIPKPLHGINPRTVLGVKWWDEQRQLAYKKANYCCEACGIPKQQAEYHQWLEAHEQYKYDYNHGVIEFVGIVALCHACHNFIHDGRMRMEWQKGNLDLEKMEAIMERGIEILKSNNLYEEWDARHDHKCTVGWVDWRMVIFGKKYGPSTKNYNEWKKGLWRDWKP